MPTLLYSYSLKKRDEKVSLSGGASPYIRIVHNRQYSPSLPEASNSEDHLPSKLLRKQSDSKTGP